MHKTITILSLLIFLCICLQPATPNAQVQGDALTAPGRKLIVGVLDDPPYIIKEENGEWRGINVDIWKAVARNLNVDYEFREMTFKELLEALQKKRIDLSIESFFVLEERERLIDYSAPLGYARFGVATLPGKIQHPWLTAITIVFSWGTLKILGFLCLSLFILGFIFWLVERKNNPDHFGGNKIKGIGSGIYWVGSTLASGVCFGVDLKSLTARILGLVWMFVCAIALSALIASLTSTISERRSSANFVTDDQLRHMRLGGVNGSAETKALITLGGKYRIYDGEKDVLNGVLNGQIDGFLYDAVTLHYYEDNEYKDKIAVYQTRFKKFFFAFGLPFDSPLRKKLNVALLSLMERPDWAFLLKRYGMDENFEIMPSPGTKTQTPQQRP